MNKEFEHMAYEMYSKLLNKEERIKSGSVDWLDTPEGEAFEEMCLKINGLLDKDGYLLDGEKRFFTTLNHSQMTFEQISLSLAEKLAMDIKELREYVLLWMADAEAADQEWKGTQEHVDLVFDWIEDECKKYQITVNL